MKAVTIIDGKARIQDIDGSLEGLQAIVDGCIECVYPFNDEVCVVVNEEGKLMGLPPTRLLAYPVLDGYQNKELLNGNIVIVGLGEEDFIDLSDDLAEKYLKMFKEKIILV